jgi:predicted nucleic acid-binding protein
MLVDSSFLYTLYNPRKANHKKAVEFLKQHPGVRLIPDVVLPEVAFLFERDKGTLGVLFFLNLSFG